MIPDAAQPHEHSTGIIVLAAGASVRMGTPKQLLKWKGESLIRHAAQSALASGCQPVVIVLGANAELIYPELSELNIRPVINHAWKKGMSTSISSGLKGLLAMAPQIEAAILMLADQPSISEASLRLLIKVREQKHANLVAAQYSGQIGTPALFSCGYFDELLNLEGQGGAKRILQRHQGELVAVDIPEAALDVDTPDDLAILAEGKGHLKLEETILSKSGGQNGNSAYRKQTGGNI